MSKFDPVDDVVEQEFDFISPAAQKKMYAHSCSMVDAEGSATEKRFAAALDLGARIQARRQVSNKSLANIYRFEMDQVLKDYGFAKTDEQPLRALMQKYWLHTQELRIALGEISAEPKVQKPSLAGRDWERVADNDGFDEQPELRDSDIIHPYSFVREVGVR